MPTMPSSERSSKSESKDQGSLGRQYKLWSEFSETLDACVRIQLTESASKHLIHYRYSGIDNSALSHYVLRHYWDWFVELLPLWLAPNLITVLGLLFVVSNVGLLLLIVPDLAGPAPSWVYASFAFGIWMYSTMDNADGRQARRTGTSSPLGELVDHSVDAMVCTLASLFQVTAMGLGSSRLGAFTALIPCLPMFCSAWETYHTHTLYLGYFNGSTEGLVGACGFLILAAIYGPGVYSRPLASWVPTAMLHYLPAVEVSPGILGAQTSFNDIWLGVLMAGFFFAHLPESLANLYRARRAQNASMLSLVRQWTPMVTYILGCGAWLGSPQSSLLRENHLVLFASTMSLVFGRMITKIIFAHLTRQSFPYWTNALDPLVLGGILANLPLLGIQSWSDDQELLFLWVYFLLAAVLYGTSSYAIVSASCEILRIKAFSIPTKDLRMPNKAYRATSKQ